VSQSSAALRHAAVDLGAESGRVMVGTFDGERVRLQEVHRFPNRPVATVDGLHWDVLRLYADTLDGLRAAQAQAGPLDSVGVDSWAADHALLDAGGRLLGEPFHYRDRRTDGMVARAAERLSPDAYFARTGKAPLPFDTIYQLLAMRVQGDRRLDLASRLLMLPDLMHYWLTGMAATEYTNATTTGMLAVDGTWAQDVLAALGLPAAILLPPAPPGTVLGAMRAQVREDLGGCGAAVVLPATHDTASAVLAVPHAPPHAEPSQPWAYISSGTWSLLGLELPRAITTPPARAAGFTNEGGVGGTFRFLTNIAGLWLLQECRRAWARQDREQDYAALTAAAAALPPTGVALDVDAPELLHPQDMPAALLAQLRASGQTACADPAWLTRAILEGLALRYRGALAEAERLAGLRAAAIHVVGGGSRNSLLCQMTADACGRPVLAGPAEATALGNVLAQAMGRGALGSPAEAREVAAGSAEVRCYLPGDRGLWDEMEASARARRRDPAGA
jgi:rhamnulokinase